jgi:orotate phosphoribosyltransferase
MSDFVPVSRERHAGRHWRRHTSFGFAREMAVVPVAAAEIAQVTLAFPLTFLKENGIFVFKRGFAELIPDRRLVVIEDILSSGGSGLGVVEAARKLGGL